MKRTAIKRSVKPIARRTRPRRLAQVAAALSHWKRA